MDISNDNIALINALREKAQQLKLLGWESLYIKVRAEDLCKRYNGCGPEWMPAALRKKLTEKLSIFEPAFLIHDNDFSLSDGTRESFNAANDRLEFNCISLANNAYPIGKGKSSAAAELFYSRGKFALLRIRAREAALMVGEACRIGGWKAWCR